MMEQSKSSCQYPTSRNISLEYGCNNCARVLTETEIISYFKSHVTYHVMKLLTERCNNSVTSKNDIPEDEEGLCMENREGGMLPTNNRNGMS